MTNKEIIIAEALQNKIFTEEQIKAFLSESGDIPLKTFNAWMECGYMVRKGQKARVQTKLWKLTKKKQDNEENEKEKKEKFILVPAFLFTLDQVVRIGDEKV